MPIDHVCVANGTPPYIIIARFGRIKINNMSLVTLSEKGSNDISFSIDNKSMLGIIKNAKAKMRK